MMDDKTFFIKKAVEEQRKSKAETTEDPNLANHSTSSDETQNNRPATPFRSMTYIILT